MFFYILFLQVCHAHRKRHHFNDLVASMVAAVLGDEVPDVSILSFVLPTTKQNCELGYIRLHTQALDSLDLVHTEKENKKS